MKFEEIVMPDSVRKEALQILSDIERTGDLLELTRIGGIAEGFAIGVCCVGALRPMDLDALEIIFTQAVDRKMMEVR